MTDTKNSPNVGTILVFCSWNYWINKIATVLGNWSIIHLQSFGDKSSVHTIRARGSQKRVSEEVKRQRTELTEKYQ